MEKVLLFTLQKVLFVHNCWNTNGARLEPTNPLVQIYISGLTGPRLGLNNNATTAEVRDGLENPDPGIIIASGFISDLKKKEKMDLILEQN